MSRKEELALLRRFEPILRYTRGEQFFPMAVPRYLARCSLWVQRPNEEPHCLIPHGQLTVERLMQPRVDEPGAVYYLHFADPLSVAEMATYSLRYLAPHDGFHAGRGRLARVGYSSRLIDALLSLSLLARGRVPGDTAAAATLAYERIQRAHESYCYYGRVVREAGWTVLQYWFFYPYNNWRSGFSGLNDHEADWEMVALYLSPSAADGGLCPEWVAYASHDAQGDDLRRHWEDPELQKVGEHPVVFAGAGSHASYFTPGEYLNEFELPFLAPLVALSERLRDFWHETLRQYRVETGQAEAEEASSFFRIPYVDYARGDGLSIGPGQAKAWRAYSLEPAPPWLSYRGLWGFFARDPFAGENAPAGPRFTREGRVRRAWYDPVGWAGLDKVPPASHLLATIHRQRDALRARQSDLAEEIEQQSAALRGVGVEAAALRGQPHLGSLHARHQQQLATLAREVDDLRAEWTTNQSLLNALARYETRLVSGERVPLRAHIRRAHQPTSYETLRASRLAETWAAASVGLILLGVVALILFSREHLILGLSLTLALFILIEASFRGQLINLVTSGTIALAALAALVLFYEFFWPLVIVGILAMGTYILLGNLRELWR